jgi:transcriptional regulator with XRE-family HTH domain
MDLDLLAAQLIRALRGERSQVQLSRWLGYQSNVITTWENGRRWPSGAELMRLAARTGVDVPAAWSAFYRAPPAWLGGIDPCRPEGLAHVLSDLRGGLSIGALADRTGLSRHAIGRALSGKAELRLPEVLAIIEGCTLRLVDLIDALVDIDRVPEAARTFATLAQHREAAYAQPWTQAVLRAMELADYRALGGHSAAWLGARLGLPEEAVAACVELLRAAGLVRWDGRRWVGAAAAVDTRRDPATSLRLKGHWAEVGLRRLEQGNPGQFSYNVFCVSDADLARLRALHRQYFQQLRAIVAESQPGERVVVANVQLFALDAG